MYSNLGVPGLPEEGLHVLPGTEERIVLTYALKKPQINVCTWKSDFCQVQMPKSLYIIWDGQAVRVAGPSEYGPEQITLFMARGLAQISGGKDTAGSR